MPIKLLQKQQEAVHGMINRKIGILYMPTAAGKTVVIYGHIKQFLNDNKKHNFIVSGPIIDLNKQTVCSVLTNLYNDGLVNKDNCDIVIANCINKKNNTFYTVLDKEDKVALVTDVNGNKPIGIAVTTVNTPQEKQYRITVVCNPTLQKNEKFLDKLDKDAVKHFYFDEAHTLRKEYKSDDKDDLNEDKKSEKTWVDFQKIYDLVQYNDGTLHFVTATPTKDNFETVKELCNLDNYSDCFSYRLRPIEAINAHMIVPPFFKFCKCEHLNNGSLKSMIVKVIEDVMKLKEKDSGYKSNILVTVNSVKELCEMENYLIETYGDNYDVFSTCSANGKKKNKQSISGDIAKFKESIEKNERSCFVVHIRQIIAGIDIPSFTHTVFNMDADTNFIAPFQIIGRVLRPGKRFTDGTADLSVKDRGYVYINTEMFNEKADKALRLIFDYYGALFEFLKSDFFKGKDCGDSKSRKKDVGQFGDEQALIDFTNYDKRFLMHIANSEILRRKLKIKSTREDLRQTIVEHLKEYGYTANVPEWYEPCVDKYVDEVEKYIELANVMTAA